VPHLDAFTSVRQGARDRNAAAIPDYAACFTVAASARSGDFAATGGFENFSAPSSNEATLKLDARTSDNRKKLMDTWPRDCPDGGRFSKCANALPGPGMQWHLLPVRVHQSVRVDRSHSPTNSPSTFRLPEKDLFGSRKGLRTESLSVTSLRKPASTAWRKVRS
jgi:hypothetical protein